MDDEFIQYIKETKFYDLLGFDDDAIASYKKTLHYEKWQLEKAWAEFEKQMQRTFLGSIIISTFKFMDKCVSKM